MSRQGINAYSSENRLFNGYDYTNQAWVCNGVYDDCGHPRGMFCGCFGRLHKGLKPRPEDPAKLNDWLKKGLVIRSEKIISYRKI